MILHVFLLKQKTLDALIHTPYTTRAWCRTHRKVACCKLGWGVLHGWTHPATKGVVEKHCRKLPSWVYRKRVSCGLGCANKATEVNFLARKDGSVLATAPPKTYYML